MTLPVKPSERIYRTYNIEPAKHAGVDESIPHAEDHNAHVQRVLAASKGGYPVLRT